MGCGPGSVTRLADFWKFFATIFSRKTSPNSLQLFCYLEVFHILRKKLLWLPFRQLLENLGHFQLQHLVTLVVAQLAEWLLPTQEICGSNSVIGIFIGRYYQLYWKEKECTHIKQSVQSHLPTTHLAERSLSMPEVRGWNPVICKILSRKCI